MPQSASSCGCPTTTPPARSVGKPTPRAMVADNDLALGRVVEAVSKSKFWKETAIFVIEDDAQNGPDHVDAHRIVALVIQPYTKRNYVDSTMYSTSSMLRTMELILGLKPMSQFDAAARPMYNSFQAKPDLTPYEHVRGQGGPEGDEQGRGLGREDVGGVRPRQGGHGGRPAVQRGDLAVGEGAGLADAAAGAGGVRVPARQARRRLKSALRRGAARSQSVFIREHCYILRSLGADV